MNRTTMRDRGGLSESAITSPKPPVFRRAVAAKCYAIACVLIAFTIVGAGCGSVQYTGNGVDGGFYPPGTTYMTDWKYEAVLYVETAEPGTMYRLQDKKIWIRVDDREGKRLLDDKVELRCCMVEGKASWSEFETLEIVLYERGLERATGENVPLDDPYSVALAKSGPRKMVTLKYRYDEKKRRFEKVK